MDFEQHSEEENKIQLSTDYTVDMDHNKFGNMVVLY